MEALQEAIRKAKWKEIVTLSAFLSGGGDEDNEDQQQQVQQQEIALTSCLDEENGGVQWNPIVGGGNSIGDSSQSSAILLSHYLQTKKWILPMLNDTKRNDLYFKAIEQAVAKLRANIIDKSQSHSSSPVVVTWNVLDIGCGTGLLGMMATKQILAATPSQNDERLHVSMVDMSSEMVELARQTVADNHFDHHDDNDDSSSLSSIINVQCGHSCEIPPLFLSQQQQQQHVKDQKHQSNRGSGSNSNENCSNDLQPEKAEPFPISVNTLVVSELLESGLLGEGWLPTVRDALQRHVHPNSQVVVIPQGATVYVAAVEGDWIRNYSGPYASTTNAFSHPEQTVHAAHLEKENMGQLPMLQPARGTMITLHADKLLRDGRLRLLSDPPLAVFDFHVMDDVKNEKSQKQRHVQLPITCSGRIDGILVWWTLTLYSDPDSNDDDSGGGNSLVYSMAPNSILEEDQRQPWQDHWHQCLHLVEERTTVSAGDVQAVIVMHDDSRIYVELASGETTIRTTTATTTTAKTRANLNEEPPAAKRHRNQADDSVTSATTNIQEIKSQSQLISPARAYQLNDFDRMHLLRRVISRAVMKHAANGNGKNDVNNSKHGMTVLDLSDSSICAIFAAQAGAQNIYSLESSTTTTSSSRHGNNALEICRVIAQIARCTTEIKILPCHAEQLTLDMFRNDCCSSNEAESEKATRVSRVDLCVAEPYYQVMEDWPLVQALNLYYTVRSLRKRNILTDRTIMLPGTVRLVGCAIESPQLHSAYRPCGDDDDDNDNSSMIHGIRHRVINRLLGQLRSGSQKNENNNDDTKSQYQYDLSLPMWQYDYTRLTPPIELARLSYNKPSSEASIQTTSRVSFFNKTGVCHAMMVWVEYDFSNTIAPETQLKDEGEADLMTMSTDNQSYRQLVQMMQPVAIRKNNNEDNTDGQQGDDSQNPLNHGIELVCTCTIGGLQGQTHRLDIQIKGQDTEYA